jgi:hypothetical protein
MSTNYANPFIGNFGDEAPSPPLQPFAGKNPHLGVGKKGKGRSGFKGGGGGGGLTQSLIFAFDTATSNISIDGATAETTAGHLSDYALDFGTSFAISSATGKTYMEGSFYQQADTGLIEFFGLYNSTTTQIGLRYSYTTEIWQVRRAGSNSSTDLTLATPPSDQDVWGVAIDWDIGRVFVHLNGTWLEDVSANGGEPGVGNGFPLVGSYTLWPGFFMTANPSPSTPAIVWALDPQYTPAGYTSIT